MEALPSLPPELVAFAAPMAREPASLLGFGAQEAESADAVPPFELYLALMTTPQPTGEAWPASGKELPVPAPIAAATPPVGSKPALPLPDAALLARFGLVGTDSGAEAPGAEPLPALNVAEPAQPFSPSGEPPALSVEDAVPPMQTLAADVADAVPADAADALPSEIAELAASAAPADGADAADLLEPHAAPDARASRPQAPAAERPLAAAIQARSALETADGAHVDAAGREGTPIIEVTKLANTVGPAVAEAASATTEWLPAGHTTTSAPQAAASSAAAAGAAVDTRAPNWQEAFAQRVQWLAGSHGGEARITLNPPELGAVDVKVSLVDDKTYVQLTAATAAARDELSQSLPRLRELCAASGIELGGASVHDGRDGGRAGPGGSDRGALPQPRPLASFVELADELPRPSIQRPSLGQVDIFA